jgi:hypothetical protein
VEDLGAEVVDDQARIENLELIKTDSPPDRFGPVLDPPLSR